MLGNLLINVLCSYGLITVLDHHFALSRWDGAILGFALTWILGLIRACIWVGIFSPTLHAPSKRLCLVERLGKS
jgi:hypothetical protein